ncbi:inositol monophosphatase [Actinorhabdospora filicis]|uniref:Inositol monophosphatase n=1 Tax=Actinorhabdospora filicis TaxID=1785913 RepID=A0A9W6WDE6_9ACTN|nr:inositol monophosphatase [Actinorhabdospora filicis]GLZ80750.1 inositol monophosphatase [Actinorhabdospora filicis]
MVPREPGTAAMREVAVAAAEAAGSLLWSGRRDHAPEVRGKGLDGDVVTDLDEAAERVIIKRIRAAYPDHTIVAEETGVHEAGGSRWTWLVDPLDGTNNIAIGLPVYVVGIALCRDGLPLVGVVHDPERGQTWSAIRDVGAEGPGGARAVPAAPRVSAAPLLAWTQGHEVSRGDPRARALKLALEARSRRLLQLWAPLVSWLMLARGDIDGFVGYRAEAVDLPAGMLIAQEAGLAVRDLRGHPFDARIGRPAEDRSFVAARPELLDRILDWVQAGHELERELSAAWPPGE